MKKSLFTILIAGSLTLFCINQIFAIPTTKLNGRDYLFLKDIAKIYNMKLSVSKDSAGLSNKYASLLFNFDSRKGEINKTVVYYFFAPSYNSGNPIISQTDYNELILPILNSSSLKKQNVTTVIIDPGHGGKDSGALGKNVNEKNVALSISRKLANILIKNGFKVIMTRNRDVYLPLKTRPDVANKFKGDIFVSIHCNSAGKDITGIETYVYAPSDTPTTYSKETPNAKNEGDIYAQNSANLGYNIQASLATLGQNDRGLKHARFAVLKYSSVPSALIETGFLSSSSDESKLKSDSYQTSIAQMIAEGIMKYKNNVAKSK